MSAILPQQVVYLAGPMSGLKFEQAQAWRKKATDFLHGLKDPRTKQHLYHVLNPLRGHRPQETVAKPFQMEYDGSSAEHEDIRRDRYDVMRSHIVLADLTDALAIRRVSIGTVFELCWAWEYEKFLIIVMTKENPHYHTFIKDAASVVRPTLDEALAYMAGTLNVSEVQS